MGRAYFTFTWSPGNKKTTKINIDAKPDIYLDQICLKMIKFEIWPYPGTATT